MNPEASRIMSRGLITIAMEATMIEAYDRMRKWSIRHLPVTDEAGGIIGILSDRDVQRAMKISREGVLSAEYRIEFDPRSTVREFMSFPVRTIASETSVGTIASLMVSEKKSAFLVVNSEAVAVGIITTDDLLILLASLLDQDPVRVRMPLSRLIEESGLEGHFVE